LKEVGSTDKGLFGLGILSAAFWGWLEKVGWGVSHTARLGSGQEAGVGAGPESHGGGVDGFVGVGVGWCIVEEAVGRGKVVLRGGRLMGAEWADGGEEEG
jgi:hypothetical protein